MTAKDDLEIEALLALRGKYQATEGGRAIAKLLRSEYPLDPLIRSEIADALDPHGSPRRRVTNVQLELTHLEEGARLRKQITRAEYLRIGQDVLGQIDLGIASEVATEQVASERGLSQSKVKTGLRYARKFDAFLKENNLADSDGQINAAIIKMIFLRDHDYRET